MKVTGVDLRKVWVPALLLIILLVLVALPYVRPGYTVVLVYTILMYIVLTMSWVLFSGPTGYLSLATAAFFGVGIYTSAILGMKLPLPVVICIGGLVSFCLALLVGALTLRLKGVYFAIFTFGLVELIALEIPIYGDPRMGFAHRSFLEGIGAIVISYPRPAELFAQANWFDEEHMNVRGAEVFTQGIVEQLRALEQTLP